ncbi:hypothetical protein AOQ71_15430 [Bradyrhizobium manausense]|uniref:Uncharacterized protein n=1 Tax=Bradyrhizobium manausense TaxID=989370 RepID=A0A0R3E108_9BRAD|nr:hypothetical protein AOQ71_15430 [Bradyrhizobium manausense]
MLWSRKKYAIGQMLPILGLSEQLPTSIGMMSRSLSAQLCHRAQAAYGVHPLLPWYYFLEV